VQIVFKQSALAVFCGALAAAVEPPELLSPSAWAARHLIVPDGEYKGQKFNPALTPYLSEPMDQLGPDSPINEIAVRKSAQTGFTLMLLAVIGHSIDRDACDMLVVQPTDSTLAEFNSQKLNRMLELTAPLRQKVEPQTSRAGRASTTYEKKFGHSSLVLAIATSAPDLSSKTIKKAFCDEIDRYPVDLDDQGSPLALIDGRQTMFKASGTWKRAYVSTPTIKGASEIDARYESGDQRKWHVRCPGCAAEFSFEFGNFKFEKTYPYKAHCIAPCCGSVIEPHQRDGLVRAGRWIATAPAPGKYPSYHFDELSSPFVPWNETARLAVEAGDDDHKLKPFYNLHLGLSYEIKGDAPDHVRLLALREEYPRRRIPPRGLLLVASADVQANAIYVEVLALAPDRQSWVVEALILDGDTADPDRGAFAKLTEVYETEWPDSFSGKRRVDAFGVDSGFRSHVVYSWCRGRPGAFALDGRAGWSRPALSSPSLVDVDLRGKKIKRGAALWGVGVDSLKAQFYADLRKTRLAEGAEIEPAGACHHGTWLEENYFVQITNEYLASVPYRGRARMEWTRRGDNHFLDCHIYNLALADYLGLSRMTADEWVQLAKLRGAPAELAEPDMLAPAPVKIAAPAPQAAPATDTALPRRGPALPVRRSKQSSWMS
jgi:phage terminase large subunit GpA-like protein